MHVSHQMGWTAHIFSVETAGCGSPQSINQTVSPQEAPDSAQEDSLHSTYTSPLNVLECSALVIKRTGQSESDVFTIGLIAIVHVAIIPK